MIERLASFALLLAGVLLLPGCVVTVDNHGGTGTTITAGAARSTMIRVVNQSSQSISYIYVSPADDMDWGPDLLSVDVLGPGEQCDITLQTGVWDVKCVAHDGQELIFWDQTISEGTVLTIFDQ